MNIHRGRSKRPLASRRNHYSHTLGQRRLPPTSIAVPTVPVRAIVTDCRQLGRQANSLLKLRDYGVQEARLPCLCWIDGRRAKLNDLLAFGWLEAPVFGSSQNVIGSGNEDQHLAAIIIIPSPCNIYHLSIFPFQSNSSSTIPYLISHRSCFV